MYKARFASKEQFEKRFARKLSNKTFKTGDLVLVRNTQIEMSHDRKSKQRYLGPYEVTYHTEKGNYYVKELDGTKLRGRIAAFQVYPYISRRHAFMKENQDETESDSSESESDLDSNGSN